MVALGVEYPAQSWVGVTSEVQGGIMGSTLSSACDINTDNQISNLAVTESRAATRYDRWLSSILNAIKLKTNTPWSLGRSHSCLQTRVDNYRLNPREIENGKFAVYSDQAK